MIKGVKILGINAGPREGNTSVLVKEALKAAGEMKNVETEYLSMHNHKVTHCNSCRLCYADKGGLRPDAETFCPSFGKKDDGDLFVRKTIECDGMIIGSPTHEFDISAECKALFGRICKPFDEHVITPWLSVNRFKPIGACTTSYTSHGGAEATVASILRFATGLGYLAVGSAMTTEPDHNPISGHFGGVGAVNTSKDWWNPEAITPEMSRIKPPAIAIQAMRSARCCGRNVATVALIVKNGMAGLKDNGFEIPKVSFPKRWPKAEIKKGSYMEYLVEQGIVQAVEE
ncbi:MAG: flavodoxin family protein [Dehalococcoidia bacterium]|nr:flavodoxin family protein [Dehalococcoidia bacterium]